MTCEAGSFIGGEGCEACPQGTYSDAEDATECTQCSDAKITLGTGSAGAEACLERELGLRVSDSSFSGSVPCGYLLANSSFANC